MWLKLFQNDYFWVRSHTFFGNTTPLNVTYPERITLRKMSGPRTVVQ